MAGTLAAIVMVENAMPIKGDIYIIPHISRSGSTVHSAHSRFPLYYDVETDFGTEVPNGDRNSPSTSGPTPTCSSTIPRSSRSRTWRYAT